MATAPTPAEPLQAPIPLWHDEAMLFNHGDSLWPQGSESAEAFVIDAGEGAAASLAAQQDQAGELVWTVRAARPGTAVRVDIAPGQRISLEELTDGVGMTMAAPEHTRVVMRFEDANGRTFRTPMHRQVNEAGEFFGVILHTHRDFDTPGPNEVALPATWVGMTIDFQDDASEAAFSMPHRISRPLDGIPQQLIIELDSPPLAHFYHPGDTVQAAFAAPTQGGTIRWHLRNYFGDVIDQGEANGSIRVEAKLDEPGHYEFIIELLDGGRRTDARVVGLAAVPDVGAPHERMGISAHFGRHYYSLDIADVLPRIGVMNVRNGVAWQRVEHQPGQMRTPQPYIETVERAEEIGMGGIFLASGFARHYGGGHPRTPQQLEAFIDYAEFSWAHASRAMDDLMIWNEWSNGTGMPSGFEPTPQAYVDLIDAIVPPIRERFPDVTIVGLGGENPYRFHEEIEAMLATGVGRHFDSLAFHPYRQPNAPEDTHRPGAEAVDRTMRELLELSARYDGPGRIEITEVGYPTFRAYWGASETELAQYLPRTLALLHSVPEVNRVYWYCLRDSDEITMRGKALDTYSFSQHHFGVFRAPTYNYAPKAAAVALATYVRMTTEASYGEVERLADGVHRLDVTETDGTPRNTMMWTTGSPVELSVGSPGVRYVDVMGRTHTSDDGRVTLSRDVVYVLSE
ncbi:MAG: hypothetical protein AAF823_00860 [Planctomycetota bacterium]